MPAFHTLTVVQQTTAHLRKALEDGRWKEGLPGVRSLARELNVGHDGVRAALRILESEGYIAPAMTGRRRLPASSARKANRSLRVGIMLHVPLIEQNSEAHRMLLQLQYDLEAAGHICVIAPKSLKSLSGSRKRLAAVVEQMQADAWIVMAATREVLEWFGTQSAPAIAFGGPGAKLPIAGVSLDAVPPLQKAVRQLVQLGHRRIVFICSEQWRNPATRLMTAYLDELHEHGLTGMPYHAPDWEQTPEGLDHLLRSLFQVTPPTALIIMEPPRIVQTLLFLNSRQLRVPQDLSLACLGQDPMLAGCHPPIAHLRYDLAQPREYLVDWIEDVACGHIDRRFVFFPAEFEPGGTLGPAGVSAQ